MKKLPIFLLLSMLLLPQAATAAPGGGSLDPSFGDGGRIVVPMSLGFDTPSSQPTAIAKLPGDEAVVLAGTSLLAYGRDGRPDRGFGGGRVEVAAPAGASLRLVDVVADRQGRILVGGTVLSPVEPAYQQPVGQDEDVFLARFTPDGQLDPSFGQGGVLRSDLGSPPPPPIPTFSGPLDGAPPLTGLEGIAVDASSRIVISGLRVRFVYSCRFVLYHSYRDAFLGRLDDAGNLDPSYGQGGIALVENSGGAAAPALTRSGGAYLLDSPERGCERDPSRLTRFDVNGAVAQPTVSGEREASWTSIAIDRRGRVLLAGPENRFGMATVSRILPGGRIDRGFGNRGIARVKTANGLDFEPSAIRSAADGSIVLAGTARPPGTDAEPWRFMVARLNGLGHLDRRFSGDGRVLTGFGRQARAKAEDLTLVRGGILVAGRLSSPSLPGSEGLALVRYLAR